MAIGFGRLFAAALVGVVLWAGLNRAADESPQPPADPPAAVEGTKAPAVAQVSVNPQVAALGDNSWLKLETPKTHPITRSSSPWMPYAPDGGVGLLWGCSANSHQNDLWSYSLGRNEWIEQIKTEPSHATDPEVFKYKD